MEYLHKARVIPHKLSREIADQDEGYLTPILAEPSTIIAMTQSPPQSTK
jgi:hypothetical protein